MTKRNRPLRRRPAADEAVDGPVSLAARGEPRGKPDRAGEAPRVDRQRLRELHQHAQRRGARRRARVSSGIHLLAAWQEAPVYTRPRTRRAGVDRRLDQACPPGTHSRPRKDATRSAFHAGGTGEPDRDDQRHQWLEPPRGGFRPLVRHAGDAEGGLMTAAGHPQRNRCGGGRGGQFRPVAPAPHARCVPHARLGRRCRGCGAGCLPPLARHRPQRRARARGLPAAHRDAALPRPAQVGAESGARPMSARGCPTRWSGRRRRTMSRCR
jgi:hypothetical protein